MCRWSCRRSTAGHRAILEARHHRQPELLDDPDGRRIEAAADLARIKRVVVATYQSVSGAGRASMDELFNQTRAIYVNDPLKPEHFTKQIAFNVIPHCDIFMDDGATKEEWKMAVETRKILDPDIAVTATCVRVPVFIGHGEAINVEFERPLSEDEARAALRQAPGVTVVDHRADEGYVTPAEAAGEDAVYVSRIRRDPTVPTGSICGSSPTICARARRSTPSRSPKSWSRSIWAAGAARGPTSSRCAVRPE